jgi:hypothetical protein
MFDNLLSTLKNRTNNIGDLMKEKSRKLVSNINPLKFIGNKNKTTYYTIAPREDNEYFDNDYLSPRAYSMTTFSIDYNSVNENMEWFPYVPPSYDEQNIVDRFIKVITINDDFNVSPTPPVSLFPQFFLAEANRQRRDPTQTSDGLRRRLLHRPARPEAQPPSQAPERHEPANLLHERDCIGQRESEFGHRVSHDEPQTTKDFPKEF